MKNIKEQNSPQVGVITSKTPGIHQGVLLAQMLDFVARIEDEEVLKKMGKFIDIPENLNTRSKKMEIKFLDNVGVGENARRKIQRLLNSGVINIKQMKSIKIRFDSGEWFAIGVHYGEMIDHDWGIPIGTSGKRYSAVAGIDDLKKTKKEEEEQKQKTDWDDSVQLMTNDVVSMLEGEGIENKLEKYLNKCAVFPSDRSAASGEVLMAGIDMTLGGAAAAFGARALTQGLMRDVSTAQGGSRVDRFYRKVKEAAARGDLPKGKFDLLKKTLIQIWIWTRGNPGKTRTIKFLSAYYAKKGALFVGLAGAANVAGDALINDEGGDALGIYTLLNLFAGQAPEKGWFGKGKIFTGLAAISAIAAGMRIKEAEKKNLPCIIQRMLYGMCFGFSHVSFGPMVKMFRDKEFRLALRQGAEAKNFEEPTRLLLREFLSHSLRIRDDLLKVDIAKLFKSIETDGMFDAHHRDFLQKVVNEAKKKGLNIVDPKKTFDLEELGLLEEFNNLKFQGTGLGGRVNIPGMDERGRQLFHDTYIKGLQNRAETHVAGKIDQFADDLVLGVNDVADDLGKHVEEIRKIVEAANAKKISMSGIRSTIYPILKDVIEKSTKEIVDDIVKIRADMPGYIEEAGDQVGNVLERISIAKQNLDPTKPVRFPGMGAGDELVDLTVIPKDSELFKAIRGDYLKYLGDMAEQTANPKLGSEMFLEICERNLKDHPDKERLFKLIKDQTENSKELINEGFDKVANHFALSEDLMDQLDFFNGIVSKSFNSVGSPSGLINTVREGADEITGELLEKATEKLAFSSKAANAAKNVKYGSTEAVRTANRLFRALFGNTSKLGRRLAGTAFAAGATGIAAGLIRDNSFGAFWNEGDEEEKKIKTLGAKIYFAALVDKIAKNAIKLKPIGRKYRDSDVTFSDGFENFNDHMLTRITPDDMTRTMKSILGESFIDNKAFADQSTLDKKLRPLVMEIIEEEAHYFSETKKMLTSKNGDSDNVIKSTLINEANKHGREVLESGSIFDEHLKARLSQIAGDMDELLTSSVNLNHVAIAKTEFHSWPRISGVQLKENHEAVWPIIARYWEAAGRNGLANRTRTGKEYKRVGAAGDEGAHWSSAFIKYCMRGDTGFLNLLGTRGGGAHIQYYPEAMKNSINIVKKIGNGSFVPGIDWIYLPILPTAANIPRQHLQTLHKDIRKIIPAEDLRYFQRPGDILLRNTSTASGLHGDIFIGNGQKIGGNLGDTVKVKPAKPGVVAILTKNPEAVKILHRFAKLRSRVLNPNASVPITDKEIREIKIKEGVKIMEKKDLQNLVKEVLRENSGQGYAPYPYGSSVQEEEQPKEDFMEEWKKFCMDLVKDLDTRISVAKVLVNDEELFEDILDLAGSNQSVGEELIRKVQEAREKQENI